MTIQEQNKERAANILQALSSGDQAYLSEALSDELITWVPGSLPFSGRHRNAKAFVLKSMDATKETFPQGYTFTIHAMTAEGERVAIEAESYGIHINGKTYNNHYHFLYVFKEGRLIEWKEYMDTDHARSVLFEG